MKNIIIYCQAPADIKYVLSIYEKYRETSYISIYCVSVKYMYTYIKSLNLELKILSFISGYTKLSLKNPMSFYRGSRYLSKIIHEHSKYIENGIVYFFSISYDWITFAIVARLAEKNSVLFYDHYLGIRYVKRSNYSLKESYEAILFRLMTGIRYTFFYNNHKKVLTCPYYDYGIYRMKPKVEVRMALKKYQYSPSNIKQKSLLLFESNQMFELGTIKQYDHVMEKILKHFKDEGFYIYLKAHPRLGHSKSIDQFVDARLPRLIPAELIDCSSFSIIIGIDSYSIAFLAKENKNVFSLIHLLDYVDEDYKSSMIKYLDEISNYQMKYIQYTPSGELYYPAHKN